MTKQDTLRLIDILRQQASKLRDDANVQSIEATEGLTNITFYVTNDNVTVMGASMVQHPLAKGEIQWLK